MKMSNSSSDPHVNGRLADAGPRKYAYVALIAAALSVTAGRIYQVDGPLGENDRSRWATVRALTERGDYEIGQLDRDSTGQFRQKSHGGEGWNTIDKVRLPGTRSLRSDKAPLLPTLVAAQCWLLGQLGWSVSNDQRLVVQTTLYSFNLIPLALYLIFLSWLVERRGQTDFGRIFVVASGCFATFVPTFATVLTNHTIAAFSALFALFVFLSIWDDRQHAGWRFATCGFFAAWTFSNALPAATLLLLLFALLLARDARKTLLYFVPGACVPLAGHFFTYYLAFGRLTPWQGANWSQWLKYPTSYWLDENILSIDVGEPSRAAYSFHYLFGHHGVFSLSPVFLLSVVEMLRLGRTADGRQLSKPLLIVTPVILLLTMYLRGVAGSLVTLIFPLLLFGAGVAMWPWKWWQGTDHRRGVLAHVGFIVTVVVVGFWLVVTNNYGGHTAGPRHLIWLTPLWLLNIVPMADRLAVRSSHRALCWALLLVSALAANTGGVSPWAHPWIYNSFVLHR